MAHYLPRTTSNIVSHLQRAQPFRTNRQGFTIVELLIVIIVIAILATITLVAYNGMQTRALEGAMKADIRQAVNQLETNKALTGHYPSDDASANLSSSGDSELNYVAVDDGFCITVSNPKASTSLRYRSAGNQIIAAGTCEDDEEEEEEEDPLPSAIAAWAFNENTGSTAASATGSHNGTLGFGASWASGRYGNATAFNGTGSRVTVPNAAPLNLTGAMSIMAWVRPSRVETQAVIKKSENGATNGYELTLASNGRPFFRVNQMTSGNTYRVDGSSELTLNSWTHLAGVYDGTTMRLYVNGNPTSPIAGPASINTNSLALTFGAEVTGSYPLEGRIDDARVFNSALTPEQVSAFMALPVTP